MNLLETKRVNTPLAAAVCRLGLVRSMGTEDVHLIPPIIFAPEDIRCSRFDRFSVNGNKFEHERLKTGVIKAEDSLTTEFKKILGEVADIVLKNIVDYGNNRQPGYSITNCEGVATKSRQFVRDRLARDFYVGKTFDKEKASEFLAKLCSWRDTLYFLMHILGGQPPRVPEALTVQFANNSSQQRNVILLQDRIATVIGYSKTEWKSQKARYCPRVLTPSISRILALYLIYIRPLEMYVL
jgi:hypothetical protein